MTISPLQNDYVTKSEFGYFRDTVNKRFNTIDKKFDSIDKRFNVIDQRFDIMDKKFDKFREEINKDFKMHTDFLCEKFQHDLKTTIEYLEYKIDKKLGKEDFFVFMEGYYERIIKGIKENKH